MMFLCLFPSRRFPCKGSGRVKKSTQSVHRAPPPYSFSCPGLQPVSLDNIAFGDLESYHRLRHLRNHVKIKYLAIHKAQFSRKQCFSSSVRC